LIVLDPALLLPEGGGREGGRLVREFPLPVPPPPGLSAEAYGEGGRGDYSTDILQKRANPLCLPASSFFLLPSSFFLLPSSFFLLPSSFFLLPSSFFLLPSSFFLLP